MTQTVNNPIYAERYRTGYPFIPEDGKRTPFTDAVSLLSVYVSPSAALPIRVAAVSVQSDAVHIVLEDQNRTVVAEGSSDSEWLMCDGVLAGRIVWDTDGATRLKNILLGGDPVPWDGVLVIPDLCVPVDFPRPSSVTVNGYELHPETPIIIGSGMYKSGSKISAYEGKPSPEGTILTKIRWEGRQNRYAEVDASSTPTDVWLKSSAECDLRVVTSGDILVTGASDDDV